MRIETGRVDARVESLGNGTLDGLPLFASHLSVAELDLHGGALFWDEVRRFTLSPFLAGLAQRTLAQESPPRVWLFADEPAETAGRAAAALAAARELAGRQQSVLVIDGDDQHPDLTRWAGRWEEPGWIDLVRYGASMRACSVPLPWAGEPGRLLGIGSFCPALPTRDEITWLLSLLGTQADYLLVSIPLGPAGALWSGEGMLRLLCWDRTSRPPRATSETAARMARDVGAPDAVIAFGTAGLDLLPPVVEEEPDLPVAITAPAVVTGGAPAAAVAPAEAAGMADAAATLAVPGIPVRGAEPSGRSAPAAPVTMAQRHGEESSPRETAGGEGAAAPAHPATARLKRAAVALASVILLGAVGLMIYEFYPRPRNELSGLAPGSGAADISRPSGQPAGAAPSAPSGAAPGGGADGSRPVAFESGGSAGAESTSADTGRPAGTAAGGAAEEGSFDPAPFRLPVGRDGWALHVQSLPDSALAQQQVATLARLGITARWRAVEIPGKGVWYRVYMGSFASHDAAWQALPGLLRKLSESWGQAVRY